ncbi:hypothetical protein [Palaeococcus ferrophilus]|uniref:hypothetical protein n=1 Tax=Palaeococcus ferrophilus TaxID=83868 RepID=UPI00064E5CEB|nr:hypothetical protein [Palaeococcus ferrophilus]
MPITLIFVGGKLSEEKTIEAEILEGLFETQSTAHRSLNVGGILIESGVNWGLGLPEMDELREPSITLSTVYGGGVAILGGATQIS